MKHKNKIAGIFFITIFAIFNFACQQPAGNSNSASSNAPTSAETVKAETPTEAYRMLFAACKAKDSAKIKQLMTKGSLALAEFSAGQQKKSVDQILENGLVAPTLADSITEIRDERVKDNFGAIEVYNPRDKRWEDLPFIMEDGGWKLAVGEVFQDTYKKPSKGKAELEAETSNKTMPLPMNTTAFPTNTNGNNANKSAKNADGTKTVEVPKAMPNK